jgi:hypothetical protein
MPKKLSVTPVDLEQVIMAKVKSNEISMKPRWYFVLGSLLMIAGLVGFSMGAIFLTNLTLFLLRQHGPMGQWRLQQMLDSFPLWVPIMAAVSMVLGIVILRKYDFSYKRNVWLLISGFIISIILAALILHYTGFDTIWYRQGPMRRFYQQIEDGRPMNPEGRGQGRGRF